MLNLRLEFTKLKRRSFLLSLIAIIAVELIWANVVMNSELTKTHEAYNAIYDMAFMNDFILPLFIAILASRLLEMEHLGKTFKLLQTSNESPWQLFKAKLTVMAIFSLFVSLLQTIFLKFTIQAAQISVTSVQLTFSLLTTFLICLFLSCLHLCLAFIYQKPSVTVVTGLIGSFLSFVGISALPFAIRLFVPWQYFSMMGTTKRLTGTHTYLFQYDSTYPFKLAVLLFIILLTIFVSKKLIRKADLL
ncbi:ABC transporter permease [Streptococcus macacae]|uniref:Membrane protein n=1 Tax=Streptococcus macacae NCTC 11558 TaxID=764298 RepID=G5JVF2_9STRE|nr:ABC transporter permease [Streptococcus macacae]EHJ51755.1 putative membrane protein [Streptococcus macacae NCTC 11558]SUN78548.1 ABC transporter, permease protein [Streptococcus macacae NCTC 11558]